MLSIVKSHLEKLIGYESVSTFSNLDIANYCLAVLQKSGYECHQIKSDSGENTNVLASCGDRSLAGIMLSAHTDVVPVKGQNWTYPPFSLTEHDNKWYGRGTADMKGYIACLLAYAEKLSQSTKGLPVYIALSYDEEIGCQGVPLMIEQFDQLIPVLPQICLIGEPTSMKPVIGHKGKKGVRVKVKGEACHSAVCPDGVNAIEYASELILFIHHLMKQCQQTGLQDPLSEIPYTTLQTGIIHGGTALNIVPHSCTFDFEIRSAYTEELEDLYHQIVLCSKKLEAQMQQVEPSCNICFEELSFYPPLETSTSGKAIQWVRDVTGYNGDCTKVSFGTEGGLFSKYGIETIVIGPGSMQQGHKPDEFIHIDQIQSACQFFEALCVWLTQQDTTNSYQNIN